VNVLIPRLRGRTENASGKEDKAVGGVTAQGFTCAAVSAKQRPNVFMVMKCLKHNQIKRF